MSNSDMSRPNVIPSSVLRRKDIKNIPTPWKIDPRYTSSPWNLLRVLLKALSVFIAIWKCGIHLLVHNDTDSIVEQTLAKDDGVELRINLVLVENGEDGNGIRRRKRRAKGEAFHER